MPSTSGDRIAHFRDPRAHRRRRDGRSLQSARYRRQLRLYERSSPAIEPLHDNEVNFAPSRRTPSVWRSSEWAAASRMLRHKAHRTSRCAEGQLPPTDCSSAACRCSRKESLRGTYTSQRTESHPTLATWRLRAIDGRGAAAEHPGGDPVSWKLDSSHRLAAHTIARDPPGEPQHLVKRRGVEGIAQVLVKRDAVERVSISRIGNRVRCRCGDERSAGSQP